MKSEFSQRVKELRIEKGLTQQQVADAINMDRSNYSKYERGKIEPSNQMLIDLSIFFRVTAGQLLGTEDLN